MALVRDETQPAKVRIKAAKIVLELTRPDRVRKVRHEGAHYKLDALHLSEPSPQRTPVLYQAGTSPAGRAFAARHAECVFMSGPSKKVIAPRVAAIRGLAGKTAATRETF